jgi:hypothetical protein
MRYTSLLFVLISTLACSQKEGEKVDSNIFLQGKPLAEVTNKRLDEISGLAASAANPGMFWAQNDSGNKAEVFLIDEHLDIQLTVKLKNVINRDWEDIAVGLVAGKKYVYLAEIGDNLSIFQYKQIYRFEEPVLTPGQTEITLTKFDTIVFQLPDGRKDTEALMINPRTNNIYVISKRENPVYLYELKYPQSVHDTLTATRLTSLPFGHVVAASFSPDGNEVIVKNYKNVYYWKVNKQPIAEAMKAHPHIVEYTKEPQGEAITFARDGSGFYTISEKVKGEKSYLYFYPRK